MHELTLLFGVAENVERVIQANGIDHVDAVVLDVGEATTVVPAFLEDGYSVVSDEYDFLRGSKLIIHVVKAEGRCRVCGEEYPIVENKGICPNCGSFDKEVIAGQDFIIREVRVLETEMNETK